jgi:2-iminobutanoate/2-iminopropanoate deaminase
MPKQYLNPPGLFPSRKYGFSQVVATTGGKTVYLSGQVGWDEHEHAIGPNDLKAQTEQALKNIDTAMRAAGGNLDDIVSMRIFIVESKLSEDFHITEALKQHFPEDRLPATTWIGVTALSHRDFLIEIEAIAVIEN